MRRRRALTLALTTGAVIVGLAILFAGLQPTGLAVPQYP